MIPLSPTRQTWANTRIKPARLVGSRLHKPTPTAIWYGNQLKKLVERMVRDYIKRIKRLYRVEGGVTLDSNMGSQGRILMNLVGREWAALFDRAADGLVEKVMVDVDKFAGNNLDESLRKLTGGLTIKTPDMPGELSDKVKAHIAENVSLIKSIPRQYHQKVEGVVLRSVSTGGKGAEDIYKAAMREITAQGINVHKRAELIARTETAKISATVQNERMQSVGIEEFIWRHSGGGAEPRKLHQDYHGQVFRMDDPPIIDERTGQRGMPGTIWNCGCYAEPVLRFGEN